jgi:SPP1 family predicted phage head-tail adaptor
MSLRIPFTIGDLRHRLTIQQPQTVSGKQTWSTYQDGVRAFIDPQRGAEVARGLEEPNEVVHDVWIRYRPGVRPKMRLLVDGTTRTLEIVSVIDLEERRMWLHLSATEVVV